MAIINYFTSNYDECLTYGTTQYKRWPHFVEDKRNYLDFMIKWAVFITNITLMHFQKETKNQLMIAIKS